MRWADIAAGLELASVTMQAAKLLDSEPRPAGARAGRPVRELYTKWLEKARSTHIKSVQREGRAPVPCH